MARSMPRALHAFCLLAVTTAITDIISLQPLLVSAFNPAARTSLSRAEGIGKKRYHSIIDMRKRCRHNSHKCPDDGTACTTCSNVTTVVGIRADNEGDRSACSSSSKDTNKTRRLRWIPAVLRGSCIFVAWLCGDLNSEPRLPISTDYSLTTRLWNTMNARIAIPKTVENGHPSLLHQIRPPSALAVELVPIPPHEDTAVVITRGLQREGRLMDLTQPKPKPTIDAYSAGIILDEIDSVERDTGTQVQVVVVDDISYRGYSPKRFATMLFNDWRIGPAAAASSSSGNKNNGVLILVVLKQRRIEIEVGKGLNKYMGSEWCADLLERETVPSFKVDRYGQGVYNAVAGVANRLREVDDSSVAENIRISRVSRSKSNYLDNVALGFAAFAGVGYFLQETYDARYPMGKNTVCSRCGGTDWVASPQGWVIVKDATDRRAGLKKRVCSCTACGRQAFRTRTIPKYDGRKRMSDGSYRYYRGG
eukprot:CAMPEP_0178617864 /NCGR_PEP_ID=MMETSP0698-20121128/3940_1 /TAXON_ID=265572 /ORGANISM="Extubocellulus spinifer, Strain CCMP396" /LENGTH=477 /DNA_ID=CAMNT_0020256725 /DNA_START=106 /DNA_END=1536 /DNA_ORIENTATION=+